MNIFKKTLLAAALTICTVSVFAAPAERTGPAPHTPPPAPPLYLIMQQTDSPNETLNNVIKNVPALEKGKRYEIKVEVKELPPVVQDMPIPQP